MENRIHITGAGRHTESFKKATLKGLLFLITPTQTGTPLAPRSLASIYGGITLQIEDKSDLNNAVTMLPPSFTLEEIVKVQTATDLRLIETYSQMPPEMGAYAVPVYFEGNKVLKGDSSLDIAVTISSFTNFVGITVLPIESIGLETHKYIIEELDVDTTKRRQKINLGNAVDRVIYKGDWLDIDRVKVESDILNFEKSKGEIFIAPYTGYDSSNVTAKIDSTYPIVLASRQADSPPLYNAVLELDFDATPTGTLYVVRKVTTPEIARNYIQKESEHETEKMQKIRETDLANCGCNH